MRKEDWITLWDAKEWESTSSGVYFTGRYGDKEIRFNFTGFTESDVSALSDSFAEQLPAVLDNLDADAHEIIQNENPDEDASVLNLTDIIFDKGGCYDAFALGYNAGKTASGQLYILVKCNSRFKASKEIIYEIY